MAYRDEPSRIEGRLIDARVRLFESAQVEQHPVFSHSVLTQVSLPYRKLRNADGSEVRVWERSCGAASLSLEAGRLPARGGGWRDVGLPYASGARLCLLHLGSEAVRNRSPVVEVEENLTQFARALGISIGGGRELRNLREQATRLSVVSMRIAFRHGEETDQFQGPVFSKLRVGYGSGDQLGLFSPIVEFSQPFYESLRTHAVPLRREAVGALKHSSRALDVYAWLASRLWRVKHPVFLRWGLLHKQFGREGTNIYSFRRAFLTALKQALYVYEPARVEVGQEGITLLRSPPPVPERLIGDEGGLLR